MALVGFMCGRSGSRVGAAAPRGPRRREARPQFRRVLTDSEGAAPFEFQDKAGTAQAAMWLDKIATPDKPRRRMRFLRRSAERGPPTNLERRTAQIADLWRMPVTRPINRRAPGTFLR